MMENFVVRGVAVAAVLLLGVGPVHAVLPCQSNCARVAVTGGSGSPGDTVAMTLHVDQGPDDGQADQGNDDVAAIALTVGIGANGEKPLSLADCADTDGDGLPDSVSAGDAIANDFQVVVENAFCTGRNRCLCPGEGQEQDNFINIVVFGPKELPDVGPVDIPVLPDSAVLATVNLRIADGAPSSIPLQIFDQTDDAGTKPEFGALLSIGDRVAIDQTCEGDCSDAVDRSRVTVEDAQVDVEAVATCVGDCSQDGTVTVDELVRGVNIALGKAELSQCPQFDANSDGEVAVNELVTAVNNALNWCSP